MTQQTPNSLNGPMRALLVAIAAVLVTAPVLIGSGTGPAQVSVQAVDIGAPFRSQAAVLTSAVTPAPADRQSTTAGAQTATVDGSVTDPAGASVAGVTVTFTPVTGDSPARTAVTDIDGRFSLGDVPGGEYDVRGQQPGFRAVTQRLLVRTGYTTKLSLNLPIGSLAETLTIRGSSTPAQPVPIAEGTWQERLNSEPDNIGLYIELAQLYYQQERFAESETLLARATALRTRGLPEPITPGSMAGQRGGNINPPMKLKDVRPVYPRIALTSRTVGTVVLEATIGRDGSVFNARVLRSLAPLDQAALGAVRLWQFSPTLLNGRPIDVAMTVTMNFELPEGD
jgi:TonB family protein